MSEGITVVAGPGSVGKSMSVLTPPASFPWKSITGELPDDETTVLVASPSYGDPVYLGYKLGASWYSVLGDRIRHVTHWAHLPEPPAKDGAS